MTITSLSAPILSACLNAHFNFLSSNTKSTVLPVSLNAAATITDAPLNSGFKGITMSSIPLINSGIKFFSANNSIITISPKPNPVAGKSLPPNVESNLSYLPPPQIALNLLSRSCASKTAPV